MPRAGLYVLLLCLFIPFAAAQNQVPSAPVGEIDLRVSDPSGAALPSTGTLARRYTTRNFHTDAMGTVTLSGLAFGTYQVRVSSQGFASRMLTVEVSSAAPISREITLLVRSVTTSITAFSPTPIGQASQSRDQVPVRVQGLTERDLEDSNALDLADLMNKRLSGVYVNENAGNPFQPDMNYRGYTASPLLGTPEGLSVYMDGVRQNQPFGDIVAMVVADCGDT